MITYIFCDTDIGQVLIAQKNNKVCALILGEDRQKMMMELYNDFNSEVFTEQTTLNTIDKAAIEVINNPFSANHVPLYLVGTPYQLKVWEHLKTIPAGRTETYSEAAQYLGDAKAHRAVATACAHNKIAILIPCHRVISKNSKNTGYRWGVEYKKILLTREEKRG